jgi:hypothetical protein
MSAKEREQAAIAFRKALDRSQSRIEDPQPLNVRFAPEAVIPGKSAFAAIRIVVLR